MEDDSSFVDLAEKLVDLLGEHLVFVAIAALVSAIFGLGWRSHKLIATRDLRDTKRELKDAIDSLSAEKLARQRDASRIANLQQSNGELNEWKSRVESVINHERGALLQPFEENSPFHDRPSSIPIVAVGNLKGGVGKTTLAANLGAYLADPQGGDRKPVLFIDLDFQGSLSSILISSGRDFGAGAPANEARVGNAFKADLSPAMRLNLARDLHRQELSGSKYFDADFETGDLEERLLFRWITGSPGQFDPRLALGHFLASESVQSRFGSVVIDLPPRATLFAYAGLCAASHAVIATREDAMSTRAAVRFAQFLVRGRDLSLWPRLKIAGVAGVNTNSGWRAQEAVALALKGTSETISQAWAGRKDAVPSLGHIPYMPSVAEVAASDFAYYENDREILGKTAMNYFTEIGERLNKQLY